LAQGYALKKIIRHHLNDNQKSYLIEKFEIGEITGRKVLPQDCEKEMRILTERFKAEERLTYKQIQSQFYQLKIKKGNEKLLTLTNDNESDSEIIAKKIKKKATKIAKMINDSDSD
jgi:hypothetical protein